jgi:multicomponent Na+:H+ antiporter subunit E
LKRIFWFKTGIQFILLIAFWLLLSGHYDVFHISMGIFSALVVIGLNFRLRKSYYFQTELNESLDKPHSGKLPELHIGRFLLYLPWLIWQIVIASLQVAYVVLSPRMPIKPSLIRFNAKLPTVAAKVILGNSITLTPGTITIYIHHQQYLVHSLMDESFQGIIDDSLPRKVAGIYEKNPKRVISDIEIIRSGSEI